MVASLLAKSVGFLFALAASDSEKVCLWLGWVVAACLMLFMF
jgi:hypothetical protein